MFHSRRPINYVGGIIIFSFDGGPLMVSDYFFLSVFLTSLLSPNHVLTVVTVSLAVGVMMKNKLEILDQS